MPRRDRFREFRRLGSADPEGLVLSDARRRRLALEREWLEAVGAGLAARVRCEGVRNGVLELRVSDPRWASAVRDLLPRIAARLNAGTAAPRFRRFRLVVEGDRTAEAEAFREAGEGSSARPEAKAGPSEQPDDPERRLAAVIERLLSRREDEPPR